MLDSKLLLAAAAALLAASLGCEGQGKVAAPLETGNDAAVTTTAPAGPKEAGPDGNRVYVVVEGDTGFWGIAEKVYGHGKHWPLIQRANPSASPTGLYPGQKLIIPPPPESAEPTETNVPSKQ